MNSRLATLPPPIEEAVYRMKHELEFRDTLCEIVLHPIRPLFQGPVLPAALGRLMREDLSRYRTIDVGWYEARWRGDTNAMRGDLEEMYESDVLAQSLSMCR